MTSARHTIAVTGQVLVEDGGDSVGNVEESDAALAEGVDTGLVGGIEDSRSGAGRLTRATRQFDGPEGLVVQRLESPLGGRRPVTTSRGVRDAIGPRQTQGLMSGGDAWAMVAPSQNSTMEWTTDWGWTTTVMSSRSTS